MTASTKPGRTRRNAAYAFELHCLRIHTSLVHAAGDVQRASFVVPRGLSVMCCMNSQPDSSFGPCLPFVVRIKVQTMVTIDIVVC
jgi:hypothetical protein